FYCSLPPHDLHSFPTRRSSDLSDQPVPQPQQLDRGRANVAIDSWRPPGPGVRTHATTVSLCTSRPAQRCTTMSTGNPPLASLRRSEEHTSELQSRGHLVCRLLL